MPQEQILNIVVAGIKKDDKWLFIKRKRGDYIRKWALIGGKMKFDEKIEEALLREIEEETGLVVEWRGVKGILNERLKDRETGHTLKHFIIVLCLTVVKGGKLVESEEGELMWFTEKEILEKEDTIIPSDFYMMTKLIDKKSFEGIVEIEMIENMEELLINYLKKY